VQETFFEEMSSVLPPSSRHGKQSRDGNARSSRSKRAEILATATEYFGRHGYEHTKWADIASAVGVGSTALYHYFESKLHCLYEIQADAVQANQDEFDRIVAEHEDVGEALAAVLNGAFDLTELEVLRNRVLVAEQSLVGVQRTSPREEEARRLARSRIRDLEFAWSTLLTRGMEQGVIPEADPRLLARAILGLYNSVWHWYRPKGSMSLEEVRDFYVPRCLAIAGVTTVEATRAKPQAPRKRPRRAAA
jgi:AcrR family transcriptional regulator